MTIKVAAFTVSEKSINTSNYQFNFNMLYQTFSHVYLVLFTVGTRSEGVWILSNMHSNKNVRIFRLSQRSEERHPKFNRLLHECPKFYSVKNWPLVFVVCSSFPIAYDFWSTTTLLNNEMGETENLQDGCDCKKMVHVWYQISHFFDLVPLWHICHEKI